MGRDGRLWEPHRKKGANEDDVPSGGDKLADRLPEEGVSLGAFQLVEPLAAGAMAQVWRGRHRGTGLPVAVKVMTGAVASAPAYVLAFRNEAEVVARLHHHAIVPIYDFGDLPADCAQQCGGAFEAGVPYIVMELAADGSLDRGHHPTHWQALKRLLLSLLEGLGHAHARGVIHRDLKPGNVLVARGDSGTVQFKLADFGLAHGQRDDGAGEHHASWAASGTPSFMAPEQFKGEWRDQGPWTDLYALGCLAYALTAGRPPFEQDDLQLLAHAHLRESPPPIKPLFQVAHGFEGWLSVLLAKAREDRFVRAADAHCGLLELKDGHLTSPCELPGGAQSGGLSMDRTPSGTIELPEAVVTSASQAGTVELPEEVVSAASQSGTLSLPETVVSVASQSGPVELPEAAGSDSGHTSRRAVSPTLVERRAPRLPADWRRREVADRGSVVGAGLGIFGLRAIPLVDRDGERDTLWAALRAVHEERRPRALVVRGAAGVGKSRLVRWVAERADEVGGATVLRAFHSARGGPGDGLTPMVARHLRCDELPRDQAAVRIGAQLRELGDDDGLLADALTEWLAPQSKESGAHLMEQIRAKAEERHRVLLRLIRLLAYERPLVLLIDDAQWGIDALRFTRMLLSDAIEETPILVLLALRDEALHGQLLEQRELEQLLSDPNAQVVPLGKLSPTDHLALVEQLVGLSGKLVQRVATRTDGNPLFAVQLVGDWVTRGLLVATDTGLVLADRTGDDLPDDIYALCKARIHQALGARSADDQQALELAALLGEVHEEEWEMACQVARISPSPTLLDGMARQGLLEPGVGSWRFTHGMIRESLERQAKSQDRWQGHNQVIVTVLRSIYPLRTPNVAARLARHLVAADALYDALPHLLEAARTLRVEGDYDRALAMLDERGAVLNRLGVSVVDPQRAEGDLLAAQVHLDRGAFDHAERISAQVQQYSRSEGWPALEARAALRLGTVFLARGDYDWALSLFSGALSTLRDFGDRQGAFEARTGVAEVHYYQGSRESAERAYRENLALAEELGDRLAVAETRWGLGYVAMWQSDMAGAREHFEAMRDILVRRGAAFRLADCFNALGELARLGGQYGEAERYYRESLRLNEANGSASTLVNRLNIAMTQFARGQTEPVASALPGLIVAAQKSGRHQDGAMALTLALAVGATGLHWEQWDAQFVALHRFLDDTGFADGDIAMLLVQAGTAAKQVAPGRARQALELARAQWQALGRADRAAEAEQALSGLRIDGD